MSRRWMMKQGKDEILPGSPYHEGEKKWFIIYLRPRVKRMLGMDKMITVETTFTKGEPVRIVSGPLAGYEGVLIQQNGRTRFGIRLEVINYTVLIDISRSAVEKR